MKIIWEIIGFFKRLSIKNDFSTIDRIYSEIRTREKKLKNKEIQLYKEQINSCKNERDSFISFCKRKGIEEDIDMTDFNQKIEKIEKVFQYDNLLDYRLDMANEEYNSVYALLEENGELLLEVRKKSLDVIGNTEKLVNSIAHSPKEFEKDINEINLQKEKFKSALEYGKEQTQNLKKAAGGSGAGIGAGVAVASLAPAAAMWVATTFGTASTGTAISALSGAAATNAALAWLGGGALATGGAGMAAGQALLALAGPIGWTIAGASIFTSVALYFKSKFSATAKKKEEIKAILNSIQSLKMLISQMDSLTIKTDKLLTCLQNSQKNADYLMNGDYKNFSSKEKLMLGNIVNNTKSLSKLISTVIGDGND